MILQQNKVRLEKDVVIINNPGSSLSIYLTADKVAQLILVDENRR